MLLFRSFLGSWDCDLHIEKTPPCRKMLKSDRWTTSRNKKKSWNRRRCFDFGALNPTITEYFCKTAPPTQEWRVKKKNGKPNMHKISRFFFKKALVSIRTRSRPHYLKLARSELCFLFAAIGCLLFISKFTWKKLLWNTKATT